MLKLSKLSILALSISLTACSNMPSFTSSTPNKLQATETTPSKEKGTFVTNTGTTVPVAPIKEANQQLGGSVANAMDVFDKSKLSRALDAPLGKSTTWSNASTGIAYTVTPTQKVAIDGNSLCRRYSISSEKGDQTRQGAGTACISTDGNWHSVSD